MRSPTTALPALVLIPSILFAGACASPRVLLEEPPARAAPLQDRQAFYREHRPVAMRPSPGPQSILVGEQSAFVVLEDGTRVDDPQDLLRTIDPGSPSGRAATTAAAAKDRAQLWSLVAGVTYAAGIGTMFASMPIAFVGASQQQGAGLNEPAAVAALSVLGAGALISLIGLAPMMVAVREAKDSERDAETAFLVYDRSLRERLDLVDGAPPSVTAQADGAPVDPAASAAQSAAEEATP